MLILKGVNFINKQLEDILKLNPPKYPFGELYSLSEEFDLSSFYMDLKSPDRLLTSDLLTWTCTDAQVGILAHFLDEELVAISTQPYRKSNQTFYWISTELFEKTHDYILSLIESSSDLKINLLEELQDDTIKKLFDLHSEYKS